MSLLKSFILAAFATTLLALTATAKAVTDNKQLADLETSTNTLIVGHREPNDALAHQENVSESASIIGLIVEKKQTFNVTKGHVITQLRAVDQATDGTGASVVLTAGGPGKDFATLEFESQRFHGIYFTVQLYAKKV